MTLRSFEVIVGVSDTKVDSRDAAIAEAARYLAYADQTDVVGIGSIYDTVVYGVPPGSWGIGLHITGTIVDEKDEERFLQEMENLAHVEAVEEVSIEQKKA